MNVATKWAGHGAVGFNYLKRSAVFRFLCVALSVGSCAKNEPLPTEKTVPIVASAAPSASAKPAKDVQPNPPLTIAAFAMAAHVLQMGDKAIIVSNQSDRRRATAAYYRADKNGIVQDYALRKGAYYGQGNDRSDLFGDFPHAAWVQHEGSLRGCSCNGIEHSILSYRWSDAGWRRAQKHKGNEKVIAVSAPAKELAVALVGNAQRVRLFPGNMTTKVVATLSSPSEVQTTGLDGKPLQPPKIPGCPAAVKVNDFTGMEQRPLLVLPSGHIYVVGHSCWDGGKMMVLERFEPGGAKGKLDVLGPSSEMSQESYLSHPPLLAGRKPNAIYYAARGTRTLMRFNGKAWQREKLPLASRIFDVAVGADGTVWVAAARGLFRRRGPSHGDQGWSTVELPNVGAAMPSPNSVAALPDGSVWVGARVGDTSVIFTSGKVSQILELPSVAERASEACIQPYVVVDTQLKPGTTEFPELAKALAQVPGADKLKFGIVLTRGTVELGASVTSVAQGKHVLAAIKGHPRVDPNLRCYIPKHKRMFDLGVVAGKPSAPPAKRALKLNGPIAKLPPVKLPPIAKPPVKRTPKPNRWEGWLGASRVHVDHAASLGCDVRQKGEWLRVACRGQVLSRLYFESVRRQGALIFAPGTIAPGAVPKEGSWKVWKRRHVVVAALQPGTSETYSARADTHEVYTLTIAYPKDADAPTVTFDRAGPARDMLYPPAGLGRSNDRLKIPKGKGPQGEVGPLWVDRTEVTVDAYRACVLAKKCTAALCEFDKTRGPALGSQENSGARQPVNCVTYEQAKTYCETQKKRLPTEAEWLYAALGSDGRSLPWGDAPVGSLLCRGAHENSNGGVSYGACMVGQYPAGQGPFGLLDAASNVAEWTSSKVGDDHVVLGGHYQNDWMQSSDFFDFDSLRTSWRLTRAADRRRPQIGFRCVSDLE